MNISSTFTNLPSKNISAQIAIHINRARMESDKEIRLSYNNALQITDFAGQARAKVSTDTVETFTMSSVEQNDGILHTLEINKFYPIIILDECF